MVPVLIFGVLVRVRILFISSLGPDFIYLESGSEFYRCSLGPGPDFINDESESRSVSGFCPLRARILFWTWTRILSIFEYGSKSRSGFYPFMSGSGFYQACPGPGLRSDSTNTPTSGVNKDDHAG